LPPVIKDDLDYAEADRTVFLEGEGFKMSWKAFQLLKHYPDRKADPTPFRYPQALAHRARRRYPPEG